MREGWSSDKTAQEKTSAKRGSALPQHRSRLPGNPRNPTQHDTTQMQRLQSARENLIERGHLTLRRVGDEVNKKRLITAIMLSWISWSAVASRGG